MDQDTMVKAFRQAVEETKQLVAANDAFALKQKVLGCIDALYSQCFQMYFASPQPPMAEEGFRKLIYGQLCYGATMVIVADGKLSANEAKMLGELLFLLGMEPEEDTVRQYAIAMADEKGENRVAMEGLYGIGEEKLGVFWEILLQLSGKNQQALMDFFAAYLQFLYVIAAVDGETAPSELSYIKEVAGNWSACIKRKNK